MRASASATARAPRAFGVRRRRDDGALERRADDAEIVEDFKASHRWRRAPTTGRVDHVPDAAGGPPRAASLATVTSPFSSMRLTDSRMTGSSAPNCSQSGLRERSSRRKIAAHDGVDEARDDRDAEAWCPGARGDRRVPGIAFRADAHRQMDMATAYLPLFITPMIFPTASLIRRMM